MERQDRIEEYLCGQHNMSYGLLTGSATTGMTLALMAMGLSDQRIAIPDGVCVNVPLAILFSGNHPHYVDIELDNLGISLNQLVSDKGLYDAVIAVHSYGVACNIEEIRKFCKEEEKILIEDFAMAQGASFADKPVGTFGDVSVVSFGAGKIIDIGKGGAVLSNDKGLMAEIRKLNANLPPYHEKMGFAVESLAQEVRDLYNAHYGDTYWQNSIDLSPMAMDIKDAFLHPFPTDKEEVLLSALKTLDRNIALRCRNAELATKIMREGDCGSVRVFSNPAGSVYWRLLLFVMRRRDEVLKQLLSEGVRISSWYPSVHLLFNDPKHLTPSTPNADWVADRILNIWVDDHASPEYFRKIAERISRITIK